MVAECTHTRENRDYMAHKTMHRVVFDVLVYLARRQHDLSTAVGRMEQPEPNKLAEITRGHLQFLAVVGGPLPMNTH